MAKPLVAIIMGSDSDFAIMQDALSVLDSFSIPYTVTIASAHRCLNRTVSFAKNAEKRGIKVIIAGAGWAAHLAGVIAAETTLPVLGVPIDSSPLHGFDALLSMVQMPGGVPVATMSVGKAGAKNAAICAAEILALHDPTLQKKLKLYKKKLYRDVVAKDNILAKKMKRGEQVTNTLESKNVVRRQKGGSKQN